MRPRAASRIVARSCATPSVARWDHQRSQAMVVGGPNQSARLGYRIEVRRRNRLVNGRFHLSAQQGIERAIGQYPAQSNGDARGSGDAIARAGALRRDRIFDHAGNRFARSDHRSYRTFVGVANRLGQGGIERCVRRIGSRWCAQIGGCGVAEATLDRSRSNHDHIANEAAYLEAPGVAQGLDRVFCRMVKRAARQREFTAHRTEVDDAPHRWRRLAGGTIYVSRIRPKTLVSN